MQVHQGRVHLRQLWRAWFLKSGAGRSWEFSPPSRGVRFRNAVALRKVVKRSQDRAKCRMRYKDRNWSLVTVVQGHKAGRLELAASTRTLLFAGHSGVKSWQHGHHYCQHEERVR